MAQHGEYAMLIAAANAALVRAMDDGDASGYDALWLKQPASEHLKHAYDHVDAIVIDGDPTGEQLDHAICRLVMRKIVLENMQIREKSCRK